MKQFTAVEWLYNHLFPKELDGFSDEEWNKIDLAFKQAKQMEKQQIIDAFWNGDNSDCLSEQNSKEFAEKYYNETYKTK